MFYEELKPLTGQAWTLTVSLIVGLSGLTSSCALVLPGPQSHPWETIIISLGQPWPGREEQNYIIGEICILQQLK